MRDALRRSGYLLEQRVRPVFAKLHFHAEYNVPYPDPATGLSRELDIRATAYPTVRGLPQGGHLQAQILCECENNAQPVVFFESDYPTWLGDEPAKVSGLPVKLWDGDRVVSASLFLNFEEAHHYHTGTPVASQYCSFARKGTSGPWIALHPDEQHGTFISLINALEDSIDEHYRSLYIRADQRSPLDVTFHYPLVVLQGDLYVAEAGKRGVALKRTNHVQYRRQVSSAGHHDTYHVDVVRESFLENYLQLVLHETESFARRLMDSRPIIEKSIDRLTRELRGTDATAFRAILHPTVYWEYAETPATDNGGD